MFQSGQQSFWGWYSTAAWCAGIAALLSHVLPVVVSVVCQLWLPTKHDKAIPGLTAAPAVACASARGTSDAGGTLDARPRDLHASKLLTPQQNTACIVVYVITLTQILLWMVHQACRNKCMAGKGGYEATAHRKRSKYLYLKLEG